ncbi:hypothetical protein ACVWYI_004245 [Bradyrhizobium sp. LB13.1]
MLKRREAEDGIRRLALEWMRETDYRPKPGWYPSFSDFKQWLEANHRSLYLNFRSEIGAQTEAEGWFEAEIGNYCRQMNARGTAF